jgi:cytochrome c-type biogenesis protein CcmH/NrfG
VVPTLAEAFLGAGRDALQRRQFSDAVGHLGEYVKLRPADAQGYLQLARAFLGTGAYGDALRTIVQGLTHASETGTRSELVRALLDGGSQALAAGNGRAAVSLLQEYVRHDAGNVSAYLALGKAHWGDGNIVNALSAFRRVLELSPNNAEALQFMGRGR